MQRLHVRLARRQQQYEIKIGRKTLQEIGHHMRQSVGTLARRVAVISNRKVFDLYGAPVVESLRANDFLVATWFMGDGERFKSLRTAEQALLFLSQTGLERTDAVLALGGGVVGDMAGFAAASYLRGIAFIQLPTTLIAQIDSSVGGKTGINLPQGKNLIGAFHQPSAVIIDTETLQTLPPRELVAGWCESIKQGAVGSRKLFEQTTDFLAKLNGDPKRLVSPKLEELISAHCAFKASIVAGDEREAPERSDRRSRRILNFGHTVGHALEAITQYRRFRHGEAVGYGVLVAGEISKRLGLLDPSELELLSDAVRLCGPLPKASDLNESAIMNAVSRDKKSIGGRIQWVLLERIGRALIVDGKEIRPQVLRSSLRACLKEAN
ncbi:MAG: 3-dehydroquinate synthase [Pyrinomonadaceae bacterium]